MSGRNKTAPPLMTVQEAIVRGAQTLKDAGIEGGMRDARLLMAASLGVEVGQLTSQAYDPLEQVIECEFFACIMDRERRVPMSHILGKREFYGRVFKVTPDVLDPRPDTETLIETALGLRWASVLDLGTGSGCIAVTLLAERAQASGLASDISKAALMVARMNASKFGVLDRCGFEVSDWYDAVGGTFDLIVSNPPYIAAVEMATLAPELNHEPRMALTDEGDGLSCYRIIAAGAETHLSPGGWLMVEIGLTQANAVSTMFQAAGLIDVQIRQDLDGRDRVVIGKKML